MWTEKHAERLEELWASISDEVVDGVDKIINVEEEDSLCLAAAIDEIKRLKTENAELKRINGFLWRLYFKKSEAQLDKARQEIAAGKYWILNPDGTETPGPGIDAPTIEERKLKK